MMRSAERQSRYYEAALWALRFVEARRPSAGWARRGRDVGRVPRRLRDSARIDLLLCDGDAQWPGAFGARSVHELAAVAQDEVNATKATRLIDHAATRADVPPGARLVASADAAPADRARADEILRG